MAGKYLVSCDCGNQVSASVHQAGSQVACSCGKQVDVPPLRKLRQLPPADDQPVQAQTNWSARHSVAVGSMSLATGLLILAGYLWSTEPPPPTFAEDRYAKSIDNLLEEGTPLQFWRLWLDNREVLAERGFEELSTPQSQALEAYIAERQLYRNVALGAAATMLVLSIVGWFVLPPSR